MKLCPTCGQMVAEEISTCPSCGSEVGEGRRFIDDYRIMEVLHEGYSSLLCHALHETSHEHVMIRLFTPHSGVDEDVAARLEWELEKLKALPGATCSYDTTRSGARQTASGTASASGSIRKTGDLFSHRDGFAIWPFFSIFSSKWRRHWPSCTGMAMSSRTSS